MTDHLTNDEIAAEAMRQIRDMERRREYIEENTLDCPHWQAAMNRVKAHLESARRAALQYDFGEVASIMHEIHAITTPLYVQARAEVLQ